MGLKDAIKALSGKQPETEHEIKEAAIQALFSSENFPIIRPAQVDMSQYRKVPLLGIAALGAAFATIPSAARTITQTVTTSISTKETLFVGINPKGIAGFLRANQHGTVGNIMQINEQGKQVIVGRMRFKPLEGGLPVTQTTKTMVPFDPMTLVIAAALFSIDQKLAKLQQKAEEILQFLKLEKQSRQRGNLNMLAEILDEYKQNCSDDNLCSLRNTEVQTIRREAQQDMLFYQEQIASQLQAQKALHGKQSAHSLLEAVMAAFCEYQLAGYLYGFATFLDIMLRKEFASAVISAAARKIAEHKERYDGLYAQCHAQMDAYQRTSLESQLLGGLGNAAKSIGQKMAATPVLKRGPVDEALINAGESLGNINRGAIAKRMSAFAQLEDSKMGAFIENLGALDALCNRADAMLTDGENLYILEVAV